MAQDENQVTPMSLRKRIPNLTQRKVAVALGVGESTVSEWERGITRPHLLPSQVRKMLEVYQCSFDELIEAFEGTRAESAKAHLN